jgi:hypothetical protein
VYFVYPSLNLQRLGVECLRLAAMKVFPDRVTVEDGYRRLRKALAGTGFTVDSKTKAGQKAVREARKGAGFQTEQTGEGWMWVRRKQG